MNWYTPHADMAARFNVKTGLQRAWGGIDSVENLEVLFCGGAVRSKDLLLISSTRRCLQ